MQEVEAPNAAEFAVSKVGTPQRWAVVGGGMLGLTLAHRLADLGLEITIFETAPELGGLASPWRLGDLTWDRHYHVTLLSDTYLRQVLDELGLEKQMKCVETKTGFYPFHLLF